MKVLVTGGAGFIGSNLIRSLLIDQSFQIVCFDNYDDSYPREQKELNIQSFLDDPNFYLLVGDIRNNNDLQKIPEVDVIIHLAAKTGVRASVHSQSIYYDVNVTGTQNLLEFARYRDIRQFVFASSSSVYGCNPNLPWNEKADPMPISYYALTKLLAEEIGRYYSRLYNIRFLALRLFTVYGPAQRPDLAIYKFMHAILRQQPVTVYGNGNSSRDYSYVDDVVSAIKSAINYNATSFEIFNLGTEHPTMLLDLIKTMESVWGRQALISWSAEQPGDVLATHASIEKARSLLEYNPKANLKAGIISFYNWFLDNMLLEDSLKD